MFVEDCFNTFHSSFLSIENPQGNVSSRNDEPIAFSANPCYTVLYLSEFHYIADYIADIADMAVYWDVLN